MHFYNLNIKKIEQADCWKCIVMLFSLMPTAAKV